jgi:hypothetical protein
MKRLLLATAFALSGLAGAPGASAQTDPPAPIMPPPFRLPTIAADKPEFAPEAVPMGPDDIYVDPDDIWRQVEFYPGTRLPEVRAALAEVEADSGRYAGGWIHMVQRRIPGAPGFPSLREIARTVGGRVGPAPLSRGEMGGPMHRIIDGFTIRLDDQTVLYGVAHAGGVTVLGAALDYRGDRKALNHAFYKLNRAYGLVLIYWLPPALLASPADKDDFSDWHP